MADRTNWKALYEALFLEMRGVIADCEEARGKVAELENALGSAHQTMDALKREIERARLIGARDLANVMLQEGADG